MKRIKPLLLGLAACYAASAQPISVNPPSGQANTQTFEFNYNVPGGVAGSSTVWVLINNGLDGRNACYVSYVPQHDLFLLQTNAGDGTLAGSMTSNSTGSISNSQCSISGLSVSTAGNNVLTVTITIGFYGGFWGNKVV